jgi:hypothetical protein
MIGNGGGAEFVDTSDGVEGGHDLNGGGDDQMVVEDMAELLEESKTPLYEGCSINRFMATLSLLNCFAVLGVSNAYVDEMLKLMKGHLPSKNSLPKSHNEALKYLGHIGLSYNSIHACKNGCCLYRKESNDAKNCHKYSAANYTSKRSQRAVKMLRHFSFVPRLKRMF